MATLNMIRGRNVTAASEGVKPTELPADIQQEQMQLARKQALVDAMLGQSAAYRGNTEMAGNMAIARSPWEAVAQTLSAGLLTHKANKLDQEAKQLPEKLAELNRSEMAQYVRLRDGAQLPADQQGPSMPGSQSAADDFGLTSRSNVVQAMTQKRLEQEAEMQQMYKEKAADSLSNAGKLAAGQTGQLPQDPSMVKPEPIEDKGGILFQNGAPMPALPPEAQFKQVTRPDGSVDYVSSQTGKGTSGGGVRINLHQTANQQGESELYKTLGKDVGEAIKNARIAKDSAVKTEVVLDKQIEALDKGAYTGQLQPTIEFLANTGAAFGMPVDKDKLAAGNQYQAAFAVKIADYLTSGGGVGRSLTDADRQKLEQQYAQQWMTPEGQRAVIADLRAMAKRSVQHYGNMVEKLRKKYPDAADLADIADAAPPAAPAPAARAGGAKIPMAGAAWLKQNGLE